MWTVEEPLYLLLLLLIIPAVYFSHFSRRRGGVFPFSFGIWGGESFKGRLKGWRLLLFFSSVFLWLGIGLLLFSLAGPIRVEKEKIYLSRGMDILFVLDESPSMGAGDFYPKNRFETARDLIGEFVRGRENDAVGLVTFGDEAVLRIPPTTDYDTFLQRLSEQKLFTLGGGTSVGLGLAVAVLHLQRSTADQRVIILLTDGENNAGEISPLSAARIVADMGIRTYTIGIGSPGEVPMESVAVEDGRIYGGYYQSNYNEELLQEIARTTGGRFFSASSAGALDQVLRTIDSLESTEKRIRIRAASAPKHRSVILLGFSLVLAAVFCRKVLLREIL